MLPSPAASVNGSSSNTIIYLDAGTAVGGEAQCAEYSKEVADYLQEEKGFSEGKNVYLYVDRGGKHNEASWGARFYLPIQDLYPSTTV